MMLVKCFSRNAKKIQTLQTPSVQSFPPVMLFYGFERNFLKEFDGPKFWNPLSVSVTKIHLCNAGFIYILFSLYLCYLRNKKAFDQTLTKTIWGVICQVHSFV